MKIKNFKDDQARLYEEIKDYIYPINVNITEIPIECENLAEILKDKGLNNSDNAKIIATACSGIKDGLNIFHSIMKHFSDVSQDSATLIYEQCLEDIAKGITCPVNGYKEEIRKMVKENRMAEIGFLKKENGKGYYFNANIFVKYLMKRIIVGRLNNGEFSIYNTEGFYEIVDINIVGKIIRYLMHEVQNNIWQSFYQSEVLKALSLEATGIKELNPKRAYINLENGMLNLYTLELLEHNPSFLSSVRIPVIYNKEANSELFKRVINDITMGDEELAKVIQEVFGYSLTAETKAEKAFMFYGSGSNGKSLLAKILLALVGEANVSSISLEEFAQHFGLEPIIGKSLNIASENELGNTKMNTERIKAVISGDLISVPIKHKDSLKYKSICKLLFLVNTLPDTMDNTHGFHRKMEIIPFRRKFTDKDKDVDLFERLKQELPAILNWALEGFHRLRANNYRFSSSKAIEDTKKEYEEDQNPVLRFYQDCITIKQGESVKKSEVIMAYDKYIRMNGIDDKGSKGCQKFWKLFKLTLDKNGQKYADKKVNGYMHLKDMTLKNEFLSESDDFIINF
jgi:putative DNA primase/helicase